MSVPLRNSEIRCCGTPVRRPSSAADSPQSRILRRSDSAAVSRFCFAICSFLRFGFESRYVLYSMLYTNSCQHEIVSRLDTRPAGVDPAGRYRLCVVRWPGLDLAGRGQELRREGAEGCCRLLADAGVVEYRSRT